MLKNFFSLCFSFLVFFSFILAERTQIFAQRVFDHEYSEIVQEYKSEPFRLPNSIDEYDSYSQTNGKTSFGFF